MFDGQSQDIEIYETAAGERPYEAWVLSLRDAGTRSRVEKRIVKLRRGNPGDFKFVGEGVYELRLDIGPGYRIYFAFSGRRLVLLLCGGDKSTQPSDIANAQKYWADYQVRGEHE